MKTSLFYLVLCIILVFTQQQNFTIFRHSLNSGARCLDGSPSAIYKFEGAQKQKVFIYFEGGGSCGANTLSQVLQSCYNRSFTIYGTSKNYPETKSFDNFSFLSPLESVNPLFYNWTKAYIPYCDGAFHQGTKKQPINFKGRDLYFRGSNNTLTHLNYLQQKLKIFHAKKLIVSGISAGAIGTYLWGNQIYKRSLHPSGVTFLIDSGIFGNKPNWLIYEQTDPFFQLVNTQIKMPLAQCIKQYPNQVECFDSGTAAEFLLAPTFVVMSNYDIYGIVAILNENCAKYANPASLQKCNQTQMSQIQEYRAQLNKKLLNYTKFEKNGAWTISCAQHGFLMDKNAVNSDNYRSPYKTGSNINQAFEQFLQKKSIKVTIDHEVYPYNRGCNAIKQNLFIQ